MAITISPGTPGDVATGADIYRRSSTARRGGRPIPERRVAEVTASLRQSEGWFFIARDRDVPVGVLHAKPSRTKHGKGPLVFGQCYLYLLFVVPDRWSEGIGGALLDFVMADAVQRGYSRMHLWTQDDNERSHRLYESRDFVRTGRTDRALSDPQMTVSEWARDAL